MKRNRKQTLSVLLGTLMILGTASCTLDHDDSGKLGGLWQMQTVDTLSSGNITNVQSQGMYWAVQGPILEVRPGDAVWKAMILHYEHVGDSLLLSDPRYSNRLEGDPEVTDVAELAPYGINSLREGFAIESLSSNKMVLRNGMLRIKFRKF